MGGNRQLRGGDYERVELTGARCPECDNEAGNYELEARGDARPVPANLAARCPDCTHAGDPIAFRDAYKADRNIPPALLQMCIEYDLEPPEPGERWEFETTGDYEYDAIKRTLIATGCRLHQDYQIADGRRWEYTVPEPGWPEPLGYVTTDEPTWVDVQTGWNRTGAFAGNVRGTIPDAGDCDRHPELPADAFALSRVNVWPPEREPKLGSKPPLDRSGDTWTVNLTYEQANRSSRSKVWVYSSELGDWPHVTEWKSAPNRNTERRRVEFFETVEEAVAFVDEETGLIVPARDQA